MVVYQSEFVPEYRPCRQFSIFSSKGWWLNKWPLLGWLETFVKIAAWVFVPFLSSPGGYRADVEDFAKPYLAKQFALEVLIMFLASAFLAVAIIDRLVYREIISMIFVFPNNWAHWTVLREMMRRGRNGINVKYFRAFCWLTLSGDIVKLLFFAVHDFSRLNVARYVSCRMPLKDISLQCLLRSRRL